MSKSTPETNPIERLLQDRAQFVSWLTRLNSAEGVPTVPEGVRSRVRADYERRLEAVLLELRGHTSALEEQVAGLTARANELSGKEAELKEQLSEAEVRHVVGEYDDGKWDGIRSELTKVILALREEINNTGNEVTRLNDVLGTIRAPVLTEAAAPEPPAPPPPAPPPPPPPAPAPPPVAQTPPRPALNNSGPRPAMPEMIPLSPEPPEVPEAARPAASATELPFRAITPKVVPNKPAAGAKADAPGRTLWFPSGKPNEGGQKLDELAFLKSVTDEEASAHMAPPAPAPPPPAPAPPPPAPKPPRPSGGFTKPATIEPSPEPKAPAQDKDRASAGQKTLKCGECGTLNRPTEWYCERCGAELAAL
ncbi:MAG: zinc finger Ran-binding domain-containing protein [Gemmatimonadales bacterium]